MTSSDETDRNLCVGQYIDSYLPAIDGVIVTVQNYARWLNMDHCESYVATAEGPKGYEDTDPFKVIRYMSIPVPKRSPYRFGVPIMDLRFVYEQHSLMPDLVHTHSPFTAGREALRIARSRKIPLIASFHSKYYDDVLQVTNSKFLADHAVKIIVDFYNSADYVWTVNEGTANTLRDYGYKGKLELMPNGTDFLYPKNIKASVDAVNERFEYTQQDKVILFVGQHVFQKNLVSLLEAAALYRQKSGVFKLLMVGDGYARNDLIKKADELGLTDIVTFAGNEYDREKLSAIYLRADLFAFPSVYDNAPLVVREAAMAKCPSVLVANSNAAENAEDNENAFLCENTVESIADAFMRAISDDANRLRVGANASLSIARPWRLIMKDVYARYKEIHEEFKPARREYIHFNFK